MPYSENWNSYVAIKAQAALGTQATGAGATILPQAGGSGGTMAKVAVEDPIIRRDGMSIRGRHGSQRTNGSYNMTVALGSLDLILPSVMRGDWGAADLAITQATMTSVTTTTSTIVAVAGSWITQGLRVGDVIRATGLTDAANNGKNLRIVGLTALVITVAETLVVNAVADTSFTITRTGRKLSNPAAGSLSKVYFTIEEYDYGTDTSEIYTDCVFTRLRISMNADGILLAEVGWTGVGRYETKAGVSAPHFTSPVEPTNLSLAAIEATLRVGTEDLIDLTSFDITIDLQPDTPATTGPSKFSPDVFTGTQMVSMNMTSLKKDVAANADFLAENQLSLHLLAVENETAPADFFSMNVPNFTYGSVDKSEMSKRGGARTVTRQVPNALVGIDSRGGAYDAKQVSFQVSNAS